MYLMFILWQCKIFQKVGLNFDYVLFILQFLEKVVNLKYLYLEGVYWKKGELLGIGVYLFCYVVRDFMNGLFMVVKQVNVIYNFFG